MVQASDIEAGHAVYSPAFLRIYDLFVHGLVNHLVWHCPTAALRALYDRNVKAHHLDIGVGTGYFLDKARWPAAQCAGCARLRCVARHSCPRRGAHWHWLCCRREEAGRRCSG